MDCRSHIYLSNTITSRGSLMPVSTNGSFPTGCACVLVSGHFPYSTVGAAVGSTTTGWTLGRRNARCVTDADSTISKATIIAGANTATETWMATRLGVMMLSCWFFGNGLIPITTAERLWEEGRPTKKVRSFGVKLLTERHQYVRTYF